MTLGTLNDIFGTTDKRYGICNLQYYNGYLYGGYGDGGSDLSSNFLYRFNLSNPSYNILRTDDIRGITSLVVDTSGVYCYTPELADRISVFDLALTTPIRTIMFIGITSTINGGANLVSYGTSLYMTYFDTPNYGIRNINIANGVVTEYITPSNNVITAMCKDDTGVLYILVNNALHAVTGGAIVHPPLHIFIGATTSSQISFLKKGIERSIFVQYKSGEINYIGDYSLTVNQFRSPTTITSFNPPEAFNVNKFAGLTLAPNGNMFVINQSIDAVDQRSDIIYVSNVTFCFNEGTKILCLNEELFDEYVAIEQLQLGNYVKTYKHGYRKIIKIIKGSFRNNLDKWNMCMYKMIQSESNGLLEDLIVTGGHSILVDSITEEQQAKYDEMGISEFSKETIDGKHLLLACVSDQFAPMSDNEVYTYYHLLINNDNDDEERFGIWANGILTETPNEKTLK
jgi:hypothetical protein